MTLTIRKRNQKTSRITRRRQMTRRRRDGEARERPWKKCPVILESMQHDCVYGIIYEHCFSRDAPI